MKSKRKLTRQRSQVQKNQTIQRLCEWSTKRTPICKNVATWHAIDYCLDYCSLHKREEDKQHKSDGIPLPNWERIKQPQFAKLLPPYGNIRRKLAENCPDCGHTLENNQHGFDQNDAHMEGDKLIHHGRCTYCKFCNPNLMNQFQDVETIKLTSDLQVPAEQHHVLVEFACTGCMQCLYIPTIVIGSYPDDIDEFERHAIESGAIPKAHIGPVFTSRKTEAANLPGGYARCGEYKFSRIWQLWENPKRYQEVENGSVANSKDSRAITDRKGMAEGNSTTRGIVR